jgi:hypothetical protein
VHVAGRILNIENPDPSEGMIDLANSLSIQAGVQVEMRKMRADARARMRWSSHKEDECIDLAAIRALIWEVKCKQHTSGAETALFTKNGTELAPPLVNMLRFVRCSVKRRVDSARG